MPHHPGSHFESPHAAIACSTLDSLCHFASLSSSFDQSHPPLILASLPTKITVKCLPSISVIFERDQSIPNRHIMMCLRFRFRIAV
mmetsp:Transcript_8340/g.18773  ORF Transcript_8340/g.18773 Transcript_8340/m.18773 type:complete len:86 (+) Transcript_8340:69-326(+)